MVMSVMFATVMPEFAGGYAIARGIVFTARYLYQGDRSGPGWREDREVSEDVGRWNTMKYDERVFDQGEFLWDTLGNIWTPWIP